MANNRTRRESHSEPLSLFLRPPDLPIWDQLPESCRQEARKLIARLLIAKTSAEKDGPLPPDEEADHE